MKKFLNFFGMLIIAVSLVTVVSCSKDDDPADNDLFVGKYKGSVSYLKLGEENISASDGSVEVVKVGDNYNFIFSNNIPNISGVEIEKDKNSLIMVGSNETSYIRIDEDDLKILYIKDGATWTANCKR